MFSKYTTQLSLFLMSHVTVNTEKDGFVSYENPEDAQRLRALYDINPDLRGIEQT